MECSCYLRNVQDLLADGKTLCKRRSIQKSNNSFWSNGWISSEFCTRPGKAPPIWQGSMTWNIPLTCVNRREEVWEGDILVADLEELEKMHALEIYPQRINAKGVWMSQKGENHIPSGSWYSKIVRNRQWIPRTHSKVGTTCREWRSQPTESRHDAEAWKDFWSIQGDFIHRHHIEPRVQLFVPKEETFLVPLKYVDVTRSTHTKLDVLQENRIDDFLNVDANRSLSETWKGFNEVHIIDRKTSKKLHVVWWGDWRKFKQLPDLRMCGLKHGPKLEQAAQKREK